MAKDKRYYYSIENQMALQECKVRKGLYIGSIACRDCNHFYEAGEFERKDGNVKYYIICKVITKATKYGYKTY